LSKFPTVVKLRPPLIAKLPAAVGSRGSNPWGRQLVRRPIEAGPRADRPPFEAACRAANVRDFTFHDLRHTAATYLAREGASEQQLKAIGGWKAGVVSRYVHLAAEDARAILEKMNEKILSGKQGA
jgi:integrase